DRALPSDRGDAAVLDDDGAVFDRRAGIAEDQARAFVHGGAAGRLRQPNRGRKRAERDNRRAGQRESFHGYGSSAWYTSVGNLRPRSVVLGRICTMNTITSRASGSTR